MDASSLAERAGIGKKRLSAALSESVELKEAEIEALAIELAVPPEALFVSKPPPTASVVDYRKEHPAPSAPDAATLRAMAFVERFSGGLTSLEITPRKDVPREDVTRFDSATAIELAKKWRKKWGYSVQQQVADQDPSKVYGSLREFIESLGAFVVHFSFGHADVSGFYTRVGEGPHTIVINTYKASKGRKSFTLAHEFGHLLTRKEGVSHASWIVNKIEKFCNKFAAILLAPSSLIKAALENYGRFVSADNDFIRLFARRIGISQEATFLRLVELDYLERSQYSTWKAQFKGAIPAGDTSDPGGGGGANAIQAKRTQYGSSLLDVLDQAKTQGLVDEIDIFRMIGLRPKYQADLLPTSALATS